MFYRSRPSTCKRSVQKALDGGDDDELGVGVAVGVSTGGPFALQKVIPQLPQDLPIPVVIVQHMPPHFTKSLAERLNALSALEVAEAQQGMILERGRVYIAQGGRHMTFRSQLGTIRIDTPEEPATSLHRPSVDVMLHSAADHFGGQVLTAIMTGMGKDGLEGARELKRLGGRVVARLNKGGIIDQVEKELDLGEEYRRAQGRQKLSPLY